jgi:hypothetical protein
VKRGYIVLKTAKGANIGTYVSYPFMNHLAVVLPLLVRLTLNRPKKRNKEPMTLRKSAAQLERDGTALTRNATELKHFAAGLVKRAEELRRRSEVLLRRAEHMKQRTTR